MSVLMLEVTLTRIFSVMSWHHFASLIISLAFLGFGAASSLLATSPKFTTDEFDRDLLGKYALAFSLCTGLGFAVATKVRFYPTDAYLFGDYSNAFSLLMLYVIVGAMFFFAGMCIGYLISHAKEAINRVYFADLVGAGIGSLLSIAGINRLGAEATIYVVAATSALVATLFLIPGNRRWLKVGSITALCLFVFLAAVATRYEIFPVYFPPDKVFRMAMEPHYHQWNVIARIDALEPRRMRHDFGGALSRRYEGPLPTVRPVFQDGAAPTGVVEVPGGYISGLPILGYYLQGAPYVIKRGTGRSLVIGVGGGIDVLIALYNGTHHVTGVEVNPAMVDLTKRRYAYFSGGLFARPDVDLVTAEGRHYLTANDQTFDVIQLSAVDTYSALSMGAYALTENYLYTTEAMQEFWSHLNEGGVLSITRWLFTPPRETLRLALVEVETLRRMGIEQPERHIVIVSGQTQMGTFWADTLLKKSPFTPAEIRAYQGWADQMQFQMVYDPFNKRPNVFDQMIKASAAEREKMIEKYPYNVSTTTDDNPFFFQLYRWSSILRPDRSAGGYYIERIPLGLLLMLLSLVQVLGLSLVFIIGPLLPQGSHMRRIRQKGRVLLYFGALGLGFIVVEITLLQKYAVFVGGPIYSMAVTLFALLVFSGLGSLLSQRFSNSSRHRHWLTGIMIALMVGIIAEALFVNYAIPRLMFLSHGMRCVAAAAALAPLALMMGMPFPMGLRVARRLGEAIVPWAWGVNAVTTTLGSILCVLASMQWGFTITLISAAVIYLVGLLALTPVATTAPEAD